MSARGLSHTYIDPTTRPSPVRKGEWNAVWAAISTVRTNCVRTSAKYSTSHPVAYPQVFTTITHEDNLVLMEVYEYYCHKVMNTIVLSRAACCASVHLVSLRSSFLSCHRITVDFFQFTSAPTAKPPLT